MAALSTPSTLAPFSSSNFHCRNSSCSNQANWAQAEETQGESLPEFKRYPILTEETSCDVPKANSGLDFDDLKSRFLKFKKHKFLKKSEHFQNLAQAQDPKASSSKTLELTSSITVYGYCADSRVCPSNILGFQPGEAFMIRNLANLVPQFENGASETNAALEFAVNTLKVENIFVIGHSSCAGIETLMTMQDDGDSSSFTQTWIQNAKEAKLRTKSTMQHLNFDQQCRHCEKESTNRSLLNLLAYPWIADKVKKRLLSVHGGHCDFLNCAFDKWSLDVNGRNSIEVKDRELWF